MTNNVTVNLDVTIDASGNIVVFGQPAPSLLNPVVALVNLPVRALYDASGFSNDTSENSLFEFWEPSSALNTFDAVLSGSDSQASSMGRLYSKMTKKLVMDLQTVLSGNLDASAATPFTDAKYVGTSDYTTQPNFGRFALSVYAHYLFGHVAATAAITNDVSFVENMMSTSGANATSAGTYRYTSTVDVSFNDVSIPAGDANIAVRLVNAITSKNNDGVLAIVKQVIGQDASRARDADNNQLSPDVRQALKFYAGDKIYINLRLLQPTVSVTSNLTNPGAPASSLVPGIADLNANDVNYTVVITLDDSEGAPFAL